MAATQLGENALTVANQGSSSRPGTPTTGMIRYNADNYNLEAYYNPVGANCWAGVGGQELICRATSNSAWNVIDVNWGFSLSRYAIYKVEATFTDPAQASSRLYCQFFGPDGTISGANPSFQYVDNWGASNDGADGAGTNYNNINATMQTYFPVTNWYSTDSGYWWIADGESQLGVQMTIYNSLPTGYTNNLVATNGTYVHRTNSYGTTSGTFGSMWHCNATSATATKGGATVYPVTGIRFGFLDGYTIRSLTGVNALITVYGLTGTEERDL